MKEINARTLVHKIIQRRWFFLTPLVIAVALSLAYSRQVKVYRSSAIITFQTEYLMAEQDPTLMRSFENKVRNLVSSLLYGDSLKLITKIAYPELDPNQDIANFNRKASRLGSDGGIKLAFRKDDYRALSISHDSVDPKEAYNVVKATIEAVNQANQEDTKRKIKSSTSFLKKEIDRYKNKLEEIEEKIFRLKSGMAITSAKNQAQTVSNSIADYDLSIAQAIKYQESLPELKFELGVSERELKRISDKLENKSYLSEASELQAALDIDNDSFLSELRKSIIEKKQTATALASQGFLKEHPKRKAIEGELKSLERMEAERIRKLNSAQDKETLELAKLKLEQKLRADLEKKTREVDQLKDKIKIMQSYKDSVTTDSDSINSSLDAISKHKTSLLELEHEKMITSEAYNQAASELEVINRKGRAEEGDIAMRITLAEEPKLPKNPLALAHASTVAMSVIISLAFGVSLVALMEMLDTSFHTAGELEKLANIPVLGSIERISTISEIRKKANKELLIISLLILIYIFSGVIIKIIF